MIEVQTTQAPSSTERLISGGNMAVSNSLRLSLRGSITTSKKLTDTRTVSTKELSIPISPSPVKIVTRSSSTELKKKPVKLPDAPSNKSLSRSCSAPTSSAVRRSIFGHLQKQQEAVIQEEQAPEKQAATTRSAPIMIPSKSPLPTIRKRSASTGALPSFRTSSKQPDHDAYHSIHFEESHGHDDIRQFAPPPDRQTLRKEYFRGVDQVDDATLCNSSLPALPTPLQRFCYDRKTSATGGVYPMCNPKPILRERSAEKPYHADTSNMEVPTQPSVSFELSKSAPTKPSMLGEDIQALESEPSLCSTVSATSSDTNISTTNIQCTGRRVRIDPRVTVTEFEDSVPRKWYSEQDLEKFQQETVVLARSFLLSHPDLISYYNRASLDPVTGTMRKKPLFSMSILGVHDEDSVIQEIKQRRLNDLANTQVNNILIVDPNRLVLNLFCRSIQTLFPKARIRAVQSGDEALRLFRDSLARSTKSCYTFDLIIVEERLKSLGDSRTPLVSSGKSFDKIGNATSVVGKMPTSRHESIASGSAQYSNTSGSALIATLIKEETEAAVRLSCTAIPSLKIGVSVNPEKDRQAFISSGADEVWGKPPPNIDVFLRNKLVRDLVEKRNTGKKESDEASS